MLKYAKNDNYYDYYSLVRRDVWAIKVWQGVEWKYPSEGKSTKILMLKS